MGNFLVGCDVGTGGTKAVVMAEDGTVLGAHGVEYPLDTTKTTEDRYPGAKAEHDPETYWKAAAATISESIRQAKVDPKAIKGVSFSALAPACILVDKDLRPLQRAHIWMDRRATAECDWLRNAIGDDRVIKLSANPIDPYYATTKLMWEKNNRPALYDSTYKLQTAADYVCMKLTGKAVTDYANASLIGIAFDMVNRKWDMALIKEIGLDPEKFPDLHGCDEVVGEVTGDAADATGLARGTPVVAGTVDTNAAWVAAGAVDPGATQLNIGTAGVLGVVHEMPTFTENMVTVVHAADSRRLYTTQAPLVSSGGLIRYFRDNFGHVEKAAEAMGGADAYELMNREAETAPVGSSGLVVLPYFMGERTPIWDTRARGVVFGLSLDHGRGHFIRALMEGAAYAWRHNFDLMRASGLEMNLPLVLSEGGAKSRLWRQIVADVLNVECVYAHSSKGAPMGNAVIAGVGVGVYKDYAMVKDRLEIGDRATPIPENVSRYQKLYAIYRDLYPSLKEHFVTLSDSLNK
jgi:xylulokinase